MHSNKRVCLLFLRLLLMLLLDDPAVVIIRYIGRSDQVTIGSAFWWMLRCLLWLFENIVAGEETTKIEPHRHCLSVVFYYLTLIEGVYSRRCRCGKFTINRSVPN